MQKTLMAKLYFLVFASLLLLPNVAYSQAEPSVSFDQARVVLKDITLDVEYARSFEQRAQGLMFRQTLCGDCGMLFKYNRPIYASMWMKNTLIPLDVAFINEQGIITDIKAMQPQDLSSTGASEPVLYALEMNQGWFASNDISVGQQVDITTPKTE